MTDQRGMFLMVFSCFTLASVLGCDEPDGEQTSAALQLDEVDDARDVASFPAPRPTSGASRAASDHASELAVASAEPHAIPFSGGAHRYASKATLMIDWMRWAMLQPAATGSIADQTGEQCGLGQDGPVWYLAGTFGGPVERACDIPAGKQLYFPLVNTWSVFPSEYYPSEASIEAELPWIEAWQQEVFDDTCALTLRLDGQDLIPEFDTMREALDVQVLAPFEVELDEAHWAAEWFAGGVMPAVGRGYYVRLQPLTPGDHVLEFGGELCDNAFSVSARYELHVGG